MSGERSPRRAAAWLVAGLTGSGRRGAAGAGRAVDGVDRQPLRESTCRTSSGARTSWSARRPRSRRSSMPLGNGQLGAAVWAASGFTAQINRTDTWPTRRSPGQVDDPRARRADRRRATTPRASISTTRIYRQSGRRDDRDDLRARRQGRADRRRHRRRPEQHPDRAHQPAERPQPDGGRRAARSPGSPRRGSTPAAPAAAPARRSAASPRSPPAARTSPPTVVDARTAEVSFKPNADGTLPRHRRQPDLGRRRRAGHGRER